MTDRRRPNAVLTKADVKQIKSSPHESARSLAKWYGVCVETIRRVRRDDSWADIEVDAPEIDDQTRLEIEKALRTPKQIADAQASAKRLAEMIRKDAEPAPKAIDYFMNRDTKETHDDEHEAKQDDQVVSTKSGTGV